VAKELGDLMLRYVAFLVLGSTFVTGIVTTVQTHWLIIEPRVLVAGTPLHYVDDHWPAPVPVTFGFSGLGGGPFYGTGYYGGGGLGLVIVIILILVLLGRF
jgi:hypothetical protein